MKNRLTKLDKMYIWICMIIASNFFGLYQKIASLTQVYFTDMIAITLLVISIGYLIIRPFNRKLILYKKLNTNVLAQSWILIIIIEIILSSFYYGNKQSIIMTLKEAFVPLAMVTAFYAWKNVSRREGIEYIIDTLIKVSMVCSIMAIIAYILLDKTGNNFFNLDVNNYSFYRYNKPHFMIGSMVVIPATIFIWIKILEKNRDKWNVIMLILNLIHIIIIGKTRTLISFVVITLLIIYVYFTKKTKKIKICVTILSVFVFALIEGSTIISSLSTLFNDNSVIFRINAIGFYMQQIKSHPLFGMGFIGRGNVLLQTLLYGAKMQYYRTDVGLIGFMDEYGIIGAIWFLTLILYSYKKLKFTIKKNRKDRIVIYASSFLFFIVISAINLFAIDGFRLIYLPLFMSLLNNIENNTKYSIGVKDN